MSGLGSGWQVISQYKCKADCYLHTIYSPCIVYKNLIWFCLFIYPLLWYQYWLFMTRLGSGWLVISKFIFKSNCYIYIIYSPCIVYKNLIWFCLFIYPLLWYQYWLFMTRLGSGWLVISKFIFKSNCYIYHIQPLYCIQKV